MTFVGIDIGTTSVCGLAFNTQNRKSVVITQENDTYVSSSHEWEKIQDPDKLVSIALKIIKTFSDNYGPIGGIGITGQMHGILYTDKKGNAISRLFTWEDKRGDQIFHEGKSYASFLSEITGYRAASGFGLVTHFYNILNRSVPEGASKICTIMDYLVMKLSGKEFPMTDYTNASGLGIFNPDHLTFDSNALLKAGISQDILPETVASGIFTGFYQGHTPVYSAIGDNQASFLGSVSHPDKSILINIGTGSQISVYTPRLIKSDALDIRPFPGGGYLMVGAALYGGKSLELLRFFFEKTIGKFAPHCFDQFDFYREMNSLDRKLLSDETCLRVDPLFSGSRRDPSRMGVISKITGTNFTPENLMAGFVKGLCFELQEFLKEMPDIPDRNLSYLIGSGNGIRKNPVLGEMLEIAFNKKLLTPSHSEEAAFGACLTALVGCNHIKNFHSAGDLIEYNT
jgi:sedoheptulokinase